MAAANHIPVAQRRSHRAMRRRAQASTHNLIKTRQDNLWSTYKNGGARIRDSQIEIQPGARSTFSGWSVGICDKALRCEARDQRSSCKQWAAAGECAKNPERMAVECLQACAEADAAGDGAAD